MSEQKKVTTEVTTKIGEATIKTASTFKGARDLSSEEIKSLKRTTLYVTKREFKGNESYAWHVKFGSLEVKAKKFNQLGYLHILDSRNLQGKDMNVLNDIPYRLTVGIGANGQEYRRIQLFVTKDLILSNFINASEYKLISSYINKGKIEPLNWVDVPDKADDSVFDDDFYSDNA